MIRRVSLLLTVALAVLHLTAGPAVARPERPRPPLRPSLACGSLPAGDVQLSADLTCTEPFTTVNSYGQVLPWDDHVWDQMITIDLRGHTLDISAVEVPCLALYRTSERCGILGPYRIVNGTVIGNLGSVAQLERVVVHGVVYLGSTQGRSGIYEDSHVTASAIVDGTLRIGRSSTVQGNFLVRSNIDQDLHQAAIHDLRVLDNIVVSSPVEGIDIGPTEVGNDIGGVVARNLVIGSHGPGIRLWSAEPYLAPFEVRDNIVWANDGNGIDVRLWKFGPDQIFGGPLTIAGNLAIANTGQGIAVAQSDPVFTIVVDGGRNRATGNVTAPACTVITCG